MMRTLQAELLQGRALYREVVLAKLAHARESVWISTANVKAMMIEVSPQRFRPVVDLFAELTARGVEVRVLHAELPSRPFRAAFDKKALLARRMSLKICPRVHFKCVLVDGAWLYLGSANLTGAGLGAKGENNRNFELGWVTEDFDTIDQVAALFDRVWEGKSCRTCKLHAQCPDPIGEGPRRRGSDVVLGRARRL
jgi:phosphatidylserine/phosphatidylglycerophosphate/cardiolipin synthase-like enzyme